MSVILTITLSPAIDKSTTVKALIPEKKLHCREPKFEPGGGGINVARAVKKLGGNSKAFYLAGGPSGFLLEDLLKREDVSQQRFDTKSLARENLIVVDESTSLQYRFGMPGPEILEQEWQAVLDAVKAEHDLSFIVASGSVPPGVPLKFFSSLAKIAEDKGVPLIVDSSGDALKAAADESVFLLKPNLRELSELVGVEELLPGEIEAAARKLLSREKCKAVVVSLGAGGALLVTPEKALRMTAPIVKQRSTVGAGDSMVAGIVLSLLHGKSIEEAVRYGIASGTAATLNNGTELCRKEDVERLVQLVNVQPGIH